MTLVLSAAPAYAQHDLHGPGGTIPDFAATPTISSVANGPWADGTTWSTGHAPAASDVVRITHAVDLAGNAEADVIAIEHGGQLRFARDQNTQLTVRVLLVKEHGTLQIGTAAEPILDSVKAELIIKSRPAGLDPFDAFDVDEWGTGLLAAGGRVSMHGANKGPTFVRTSAAPRAGDHVIHLESAVTGWQVGDEVFLPDTRHVGEEDKFDPRATQRGFAIQPERRTILAIAADRRSLTLSSPLLYDHLGARNADLTPAVRANGTKLLPHIGNLSRNIVVRSQTPGETLRRGHTVYTHRADVVIAYVEFRDLGRTRAATVHQTCAEAGGGDCNHVGRYPVHIHHLWGAENPARVPDRVQFQVIGNAVIDSLKWPIAVHASHHGWIKWNVVYGGDLLTGAGIAVEDGSEFNNLFESNFVAVIRGDVNPRESGTDTLTPGSGGECFWAAGQTNRFINNVASTCRNPTQQVVAGAGFKFFSLPGVLEKPAIYPKFPGADLSDPDQRDQKLSRNQPLLQFEGNEVYGTTASAFTLWHLGTDGRDLPALEDIGESVIKDLTAWHMYESAVWLYPSHRLTIDGLFYRIDPEAEIVYWEPAVQAGDYRTMNLTIRNADVHAGGVFGAATALVQNVLIEDVRATTYGEAFGFESPWTPGTQDELEVDPGITVELKRNVISPWPSRSLQTIATFVRYARPLFDELGNPVLDPWGQPEVENCVFPTDSPDCVVRTKFPAQPHVPYRIFVEDYQGEAGRNFRVYWKEQESRADLFGGQAPCTADPPIGSNDTPAYPEIKGIVCLAATPPPDDTTPPETTLLNGPPAQSTSRVAVFIFSSEAGATFECSIDGSPYEACASPFETAPLDDGTHTFQVRARDAAGNLDASPVEYSWSIDATAPETSLDTTPAALSNDRTGDFTFSSEAGAAFECRVDGGPFTACMSPFATAQLADGSHTFEVRAADAFGNVDASPGSFTWTIDATGPVVTQTDIEAVAPTADGIAVPFTPNVADPHGPVALNCAPPTGSTFPLGTTVVACTATDSLLNEGFGSFSVTVSLPPGTTSHIITDADLAGGTATVQTASNATPAQPIAVAITTSVPGTITIALGAPGTPPASYEFLGQQATITVPPSPAAPYTIVFTIDASLVGGLAPDDVVILRNGEAVPACSDAASPAPDPCVAGRTVDSDGDVRVSVRSSSGSVWNAAALRDHAPTIVTPSAQTNVEDQPIADLAIEANDADGDTLTFEATGLPDGLAIDADSGVISGTPTTPGTTSVKVTVTANGKSASAEFTWTITSAVNHRPTLENPGKQHGREGDAVELQLVGKDPDGDSLRYSAFGLPPGLELNADTGLIKGTLAKKGDYWVLVRVTDGKLSAFRLFVWEVERRNKPPVIKTPRDQVSEAGRKVSLEIDAHDPDHDRLEFSAANLPPGLSIGSKSGVISGRPTTPGVYQVVVTVSDGSASDSAAFRWTIHAPNRAPIVQSPGNQQNRRNQPVTLQIVASDPDGDPLTYRADDLPEGLSIDRHTGLITGTIECREPGAHHVEIEVSDGKAVKSIKFTWTILPNGRPTASNPGAQVNRVGDPVALQVEAVDPDGDELEYEAIGLPAGLRIDRRSGMITGTIAAKAAIIGTHKVEVLASDGRLRHAIFFNWKIVK